MKEDEDVNVDFGRRNAHLFEQLLNTWTGHIIDTISHVYIFNIKLLWKNCQSFWLQAADHKNTQKICISVKATISPRCCV